MKILVAGIAGALLSIGSVAASAPMPQFSTRSVWAHPTDNANSCFDFACARTELQKTHAPREVVAAAESLSAILNQHYQGHLPFWVAAYALYKPVSLITYGCGQCRVGGFILQTSAGLWLAGAESPAFESYLAGSPLRRAHPSALYQRGDTFLGAPPLPGGGRRFTFGVTIADCEACEPYAALSYAYDFDGAGKYLGLRMLGRIPVAKKFKGKGAPINP